MATMDLFLPIPELEFPKAASRSLDEDSRNWTQAVLAEAYKSCPAIAEFAATVVFSEKDDSQGYAFGNIVLEATVDSPLAATRVGGAKAQRAVVPVIIKNYQLLPLDVFMDSQGRAFPLTDARLREALFRPEVGEAVTADQGDTSLYNLLYPLGRIGGGTFGGGFGAGGSGGMTTILGNGMKFASDADYSLLGELASTMHAPDVRRLTSALEDEATKEAALSNSAMTACLRHVAEVEESALTSADSLIKAAAAMIATDVHQIGYSEELGSYWVKSASSRGYSPTPDHILDRGQLLKLAGEAVVRKVDLEGTVVLNGDNGAAPDDDDSSTWKIIGAPGIYRTRSSDGTELLGWVLPNLVDLDGTKMPQAVFTNGSSSMVQDQIMGSQVSTGVDLPNDKPTGIGVFYASGAGVEATVPLNVIAKVKGKDGETAYEVKTMMGQQATLRLVPGLLRLEEVDGELFLPENAKFIRLDRGEPIALASSPEELRGSSTKKTASISVRGDGLGEYIMTWDGLPKLASVFSRRLDHDSAAFAMALAGVPAHDVMNKLAAADRGPVRDVPARDIVMFADRLAEAKVAGASMASIIAGLKQSLVKEAAALPSAMTVDAVLSLGFLNPENVRLFLSRLPYLEKALSMLCEMVVASRLGLASVPEGAASRAARGLDAVVTGLRGLALLETDQAS